MGNRTANRVAFTIVELLISLAIMAMLLTAVAVAFNASAKNLNENSEIYQNTTLSRMALTRISSHIRTAQSVTSISSSQCRITTGDGQDYTFRYDSAGKTLYLDVTVGGTASHYVLCTNVTAMTFSGDAAAPSTKTVRVQMTVTTGNNSETVCEAVTLRRMLS